MAHWPACLQHLLPDRIHTNSLFCPQVSLIFVLNEKYYLSAGEDRTTGHPGLFSTAQSIRFFFLRYLFADVLLVPVLLAWNILGALTANAF